MEQLTISNTKQKYVIQKYLQKAKVLQKIFAAPENKDCLKVKAKTLIRFYLILIFGIKEVKILLRNKEKNILNKEL